ncbi:hypothetical protein [Sporocytophaga myxococcoides]|uniref:hypothetical protein n=1 Tax=Sporocytophaga myxococcoides TaxID=153721 RepID=UPI0004094D42|nr:hypothetical protein [Sporocytophaga myxococcoides]
MYVIEVKQQTEAWLVAICSCKEQAIAYLNTLTSEIQAHAYCYEIAIITFPFVVIEHSGIAPETKSNFEFCSIEELRLRLNALRKQTVSDQEHVYFKYYFIGEEYFQSISDDNYMTYLQHTVVTNHLLNEPYEVSVFHEQIKRFVSNCDIEGLNELFEQTKTVYTSRLEKEDLALNGYSNLFWDMNYDHACGKLTEAGMQHLLPMVENMELLLDEKKWQHRSFALHILLEQACNDAPEKAPFILEDTIDSFNNYLLSDPNEALEIHRLISLAHRMVMEVDTRHAFMHWSHALTEIKKATAFLPEKASWSTLLQLIYMPLSGDRHWQYMQLKARESCEREMFVLESTYGASIAYPIALAYQHLKEYLDWKKINGIFPEMIALCWAEKALAYNPQETSHMDLHECAQFFNQIGLANKRVDFLLKTISLYEPLLRASSDCALEVYYTANLWKEIAEINLIKHGSVMADKAMEEAQAIYKKYFEQIKYNPSMNLRYAEFLEYCYTYEGNIVKPGLSDLKQIADEVEIQSEGFLSYPYELLMRIALFQNNEKQAILELTRSMILHESCADSIIDKLLEEFKESDYKHLNMFLNDTKSFIHEVSKNYYYDPKIKWKQMKTMQPEELIAYWEHRKNEIRNRPALF